MHATIFQRTRQGQAAVCGESSIDPLALHLLLRFNGYTALEYLGQTGDDAQVIKEIAQQLLDTGLIEYVGEDALARSSPVRGSSWGCLDMFVAA